MRIAYGITFNLSERRERGRVILLNALLTFQNIFGEMRASGLHYRRGNSMIYENFVQSASIPVSPKRSFPQKVMFAMKGLLDDESIQEIVARRYQRGLRDDFLYYCRNISRLCIKDYLLID
ncbi:hypothetical protein N7G274_009085 [Stereocaulon virgatum]|uniref:Uncharacterized protein n=1 Tax=Stereocaulon virgatum TaxID=373712 RepID=A0ABR4A462_9LECA